MGEKYGVTIVKTADIEVDLDEARARLRESHPSELAELEMRGDLGGIAELYVSLVEGTEIEPDFGREIMVYPVTDSHVGTEIEIEVCAYCGSPRLTQDATVDCLTGEVRNVYDGVFCRDCENESKSSNTVTVGPDFDPDVDFYKENDDVSTDQAAP